MKFTKLFLITAIFTIIPGQLLRIPMFGAGVITLSDIFVFLTLISFLLESQFVREKPKFPNQITIFTFFFVISALIATLFSLNFYTPNEILEGIFLFIRFLLYLSILVVSYNITEPKKGGWTNGFLLSGFIFAVIGFIQFFLFPDLSSYTELGWDPHIFRLFSTTLDPNFTGGILSVFFAFSFSAYLYKKKIHYLALSIVFTAAILMTFSRSSYLSLVVVLTSVSLQKSRNIALVSLVSFFILLALIPQTRTRVIGALTIDDTANARIESWQKALKIFLLNPIFGVGFNNYRLAQEHEGLFGFQNQSGGHSGAGSDSSLLTVAATTGVGGLATFVILIGVILKNLYKNAKNNYISLASFSAFLGIIFHSQFVNSFFYPQMMLIMWFLIGLKLKNDI